MTTNSDLCLHPSRGGFLQFDPTANILHRFCVTTVMSMKLRGNGRVFVCSEHRMMREDAPNGTRIQICSCPCKRKERKQQRMETFQKWETIVKCKL